MKKNRPAVGKYFKWPTKKLWNAFIFIESPFQRYEAGYRKTLKEARLDCEAAAKKLGWEVKWEK